MLFQHTTRQTLARLLLVWFALMQIKAVVFRHAHRLPNGRIITHSHPFWPTGKGPIQPNSHSANELQLLDSITNGSFVSEPPQAVDFQTLLSVQPFTHLLYQPAVVRASFHCFSHRGPPTFQ